MPETEMICSSEADARIHIDQLLREAGWDPADKRQVSTEVPVSSNVNEVAAAFSATITDGDTVRSAPGRIDYILHAADGKPLAIIEAILYQQMRGCGTRTAPHIGKQGFVIYDFFKNHEYFGDSDEHTYTGSGMGSGGGEKPGPGGGELIELNRDDRWRERVTYVEVGPLDTRVDKDEYRSRWEQTIREAETSDPILSKIKKSKPARISPTRNRTNCPAASTKTKTTSTRKTSATPTARHPAPSSTSSARLSA